MQRKALEAAMNDIDNSFGKGSVTRLGSTGGALVYVFLFLILSAQKVFAYWCSIL